MSSHSPKLVLASASPRRRRLLRLLGPPFEVTEADVDEFPRSGEAPEDVVARLSQEKAEAARWALTRASGGGPGLVVVACDTVVAMGGEILGKPRDGPEATAMLRRLRGRRHEVYSAITLADTSSGRRFTDVACTDVTMRRYTEAEIGAYVASGDSLDKAGAYAIQSLTFQPVAKFRGCYASVMGLPLCHLARRLRAWGIEPAADLPARCQAHTGEVCAVYPTILG
jgi:MAF protein